MTDVAWICAAFLGLLATGLMIWFVRMFRAAAQKNQTEAQAHVVASMARETVTVERSMAEAQTAAPGDDAALQDRLEAGKF
nr:hypothetical protein [uncultured Acetobacter sp.]